MFEIRQDILFYQLRDAFLFWIVIPLGIITTGQYLDRLFQFSILYQNKIVLLPAALLLACGLLFISLSIKDLSFHGHGTPNKLRPARILVTHGTYSICRHPMFFGYDLIASAIALFFNSKGILLGSIPFFLCLQVVFLYYEEQLLSKKFRSTFADYKRSVPFLSPLTHWKTKQHDPS